MSSQLGLPSRFPPSVWRHHRSAALKRDRFHSLLGLAVVVTLLLVACGGPSATSYPASGNQPGQPQSSTTANLATDFPVQVYRGEDVLGGKDIQFSSLFGKGQPVVLNFFAGLCPPCRAEMPDIQSVSAQYQGKVTIFGLDIGPFVGLGSQENGKALVQELGVSYPTGTTSDSRVVGAYQIMGMPTTVFLTPDGKVFRTWSGLLTRAKLTELVEDLLKASAR